MKAEKTALISSRDRALLILLAVVAVAYVATIPWRARLAREAAQLSRQAAQRQHMNAVVAAMLEREAAARKLVADLPNVPQAHAALASVLQTENRYGEAISEWKTVARLNPKNAQPHEALGLIYDRSGMQDLAIDEYRRALAIDPNDTNALTPLAFRYVALGWNRQAEQLLKKALPALQTNPRVHVTLGLVYFQNNDYADAERELLTARRLDPSDPRFIGPLVQVYSSARRYPEALKAIDDAMAAGQDRKTLLITRARVLLEMNAPGDAIKAANEVLSDSPQDVGALYYRGTAEKLKGDTATAVRDLEQVRAIDPMYEKTLLTLGQLYLQHGNAGGQALIDEYNRNAARNAEMGRLTLAVRSKPDDPDAHLAVARYYLRTGNLSRAIVELKRTLELRPNDNMARSLLAQALQARGQSRTP